MGDRAEADQRYCEGNCRQCVVRVPMNVVEKLCRMFEFEIECSHEQGESIPLIRQCYFLRILSDPVRRSIFRASSRTCSFAGTSYVCPSAYACIASSSVLYQARRFDHLHPFSLHILKKSWCSEPFHLQWRPPVREHKACAARNYSLSIP